MVLTLSVGLGGCSTGSTTRQKKIEQDLQAIQSHVDEQGSVVAKMDERIKKLEEKIELLNEKMRIHSTTINSLSMTKKAPPSPKEKSNAVGVSDYQWREAGETVRVDPAPSDPEAGFAQDASVQKFREAMILYRGHRYPEAILAFNDFVKNFTDHPLASAAQFHIGESYFLQKEYRLAAEEFRQFLVSHDRSSYVPQTLKRLAEAEEKLEDLTAAARHRQMLFTLFPQSPAANEAIQEFGSAEKMNEMKKSIQKQGKHPKKGDNKKG